MGQGAFHWLRPFRNRESRKGPPPGYTPFPHYANALHFSHNRRSYSDSELPHSDASSTIPYHGVADPASPTSLPLSPPSSTALFAADVPPLPPRSPPPKGKGGRRSRRVDGPKSYRWAPSSSGKNSPDHAPFRPHSQPNSPGIELAHHNPDMEYGPPSNYATVMNNMQHMPQSPDYGAGPQSPEFGRKSFPPRPPSVAGSDAMLSEGGSSVPNSLGQLDNFIPHRPDDRLNTGISALRTSTMTSEAAERTEYEETGGRRYSAKHGGRFVIFRKRGGKEKAPPVHVENDYFGAVQHDDRTSRRPQDIGEGEEVLIKFLRNTLGPRAENLAVRLMNKTPITSSSSFTYVIHQATEDSDLDIIRRDLNSGRCYASGVKLLGGGWCNLLLGDRFAVGNAPRQRHELTYRRSTCSCLACLVKTMEMVRQQSDKADYPGSDAESAGISAEVLSTMSSRNRTPVHSAMANFVVRCKLPPTEDLKSIGGSSSTRELEIGTVVRLNYRASAKLKFTDDVKELFGHFAYTGPITHEEVYRKVTTIGVHYYLYNKGKKERKVYIQGELIRLPVQVGVVKLGTQPMYMPELGATFCLHRKQVMSIYVGEIVLEGNSLGSFIKTGIQYYIGFGEERGVQPVYPNKTLGKARKLGINELLLHHHMVDDLEVKCI